MRAFVSVCLILLLTGCVFLPKMVEKEESEEIDCQLVTREMTLELNEELSYGINEILNSCNNDDCGELFMVAMAIPIGTFIVSGSIVVVGNSVHWLEREGRCDDGIIKTRLDKFLAMFDD